MSTGKKKSIPFKGRNKIRVVLEGDPKDNGHVRLEALSSILDSFRVALNHTEKLLRGGKGTSSIYYRITNLTHNSPATLEIEAVTKKSGRDNSSNVMESFVSNIKLISSKGEIPQGMDLADIMAYEEIAAPKNPHLSSIKVKPVKGRRPLNLGREYTEMISKAIGPDETYIGTVRGRLDDVLLHGKRIFRIYPESSFGKLISCTFKEDMLEDVKKCLEGRVTVFGHVKYKTWNSYPHAIDVIEFKPIPEDDALPTMSELYGVAPNLTNGLSTEEYLERQRDDEWE